MTVGGLITRKIVSLTVTNLCFRTWVYVSVCKFFSLFCNCVENIYVKRNCIELLALTPELSV